MFLLFSFQRVGERLYLSVTVVVFFFLRCSSGCVSRLQSPTFAFFVHAYSGEHFCVFPLFSEINIISKRYWNIHRKAMTSIFLVGFELFTMDKSVSAATSHFMSDDHNVAKLEYSSRNIFHGKIRNVHCGLLIWKWTSVFIKAVP